MPIRAIYSNVIVTLPVAGATATMIIPENKRRVELVIENRTDGAILVSVASNSPADIQKAFLVGVGKAMSTSPVDAHYAVSLSSTVPVVGVLFVMENIDSDI